MSPLCPQSPYQCNLLIAGYDEGVGPSLYWLDYLATLHKVNTGGTGYGECRTQHTTAACAQLSGAAYVYMYVCWAGGAPAKAVGSCVWMLASHTLPSKQPLTDVSVLRVLLFVCLPGVLLCCCCCCVVFLFSLLHRFILCVVAV